MSEVSTSIKIPLELKERIKTIALEKKFLSVLKSAKG